MQNTAQMIKQTLRSRRAQILLPAVMLAPIFILLVYLLFETSKLSMTKVRQQFALDNGAYSQMSSASGYLNALAQVNGPLPYRVMKTMTAEIPAKKYQEKEGQPITVFDVFYQAGAFPAAGPNYEQGPAGAVANPTPSAEATSWQFKYAPGTRDSWEKEDPKDESNAASDGNYVMTKKDLTDNYFFNSTTIGVTSLFEYLQIFVRTGSIYASQDYVYKDVTKNSRMFRESYYLNSRDCRRTECGKQAGATLDKYVLESKPFEINNARFWLTQDIRGSTEHSGSHKLDLDMEEIINAKLFQFAYLPSSSRTKLRKLAKGVVLKQKFTVPANRFNINLTQRYQPYVRNTVAITCPRANNNCVWPDPISKYSVRLRP